MNEKEAVAGLAPSPSYRYADIVENQLFVAGQVPLDSDGTLVGRDDPKLQTTTCLGNLKLLVGAHGFNIGDVRQLTIYVVGEHQNLLDTWEAVTDWFGGEVPPATLLGVTLLGYVDQLVEVDATIVRRS